MVPPPEESRKKMKKYTLNITAAMLFALVTISPALVGSSCVAPKGEQEDTASTAIKTLIPQHYNLTLFISS